MGRYQVTNKAGMEVCTGILQLFYGDLWESTMDRIEHRFDGYVRSLFFRGSEYRVYRLIGTVEPGRKETHDPSVKPLTAVG